MKIVMLGNFQVPYCTEQDWAWTYEHLGHEVVRLQENEATTEQVLEECGYIEFGVKEKRADIFHYVHTHGWHTPGNIDIETMLYNLRTIGVPSVGVHLDYWRGLERETDVGRHPWWHTDFTFTADGGSNDWYREQGINHYYLKAGVVERDCYLGEYREEYACDVAFVGSYHYHPEWPYRRQLIDWLSNTYGDRFRRYAGDTEWGTIRGKDLNDLYASVKVVVGDTLCIGFDHPDYFSDRVFETTGRGGFMIFPRIDGLDNVFMTDVEAGQRFHWEQDVAELSTYRFNDFQELKAKIEWHLWNESERETIRLAGHERTKRDHTYTNRVQEMFEILKQEGAL